MSTQYTLIEKNGMLTELDERSNRFSIDFTTKDETASFGEFTPEEVVGVALEMLKTASYWTDSEGFKKAVESHINGKPDRHYYRDFIREIEEASR